jgi:hypothetical protein
MLRNKFYARITGYPHFQDVAICWPALASAGQGKILAQVTALLPMASLTVMESRARSRRGSSAAFLDARLDLALPQRISYITDPYRAEDSRSA